MFGGLNPSETSETANWPGLGCKLQGIDVKNVKLFFYMLGSMREASKWLICLGERCELVACWCGRVWAHPAWRVFWFFINTPMSKSYRNPMGRMTWKVPERGRALEVRPIGWRVLYVITSYMFEICLRQVQLLAGSIQKCWSCNHCQDNVIDLKSLVKACAGSPQVFGGDRHSQKKTNECSPWLSFFGIKGNL